MYVYQALCNHDFTYYPGTHSNDTPFPHCTKQRLLFLEPNGTPPRIARRVSISDAAFYTQKTSLHMIWIINQNKKDQMGSSARYVTMPVVRTRVKNTSIRNMASINPGSLAQPQPTTKLYNIIQHIISSFAGSHSVFLTSKIHTPQKNWPNKINWDCAGHE
jgi:hypothetical protein